MKKLWLLTGFLLFSVMPGVAQELNWEQRKNLKDSIYHLINEYRLSVIFRELDRPGISEEKIERFRSLFAPNAFLINDIYPVYAEDVNKPDYPYQLTEQSLEDYINTIRQAFPEGLRVNLLGANIDYKDVNKGQIRVFLDKEVSGMAADSSLFQNRDTLALYLDVQPELGRVKIASIRLIGSDFQCLVCDYDEDGIMDVEDPDPKIPNVVASRDTIKKASKLSISIFAGGMLVNPELAPLQTSGYTPIAERTQLGNMAYASGKNFNFSVAADYFFRKNLGISLGLGYSSHSFDVAIDTFHVEYPSMEADSTRYRQLLSAGNIEEQVQAQYIIVPLMLKYQKNISEKIGFYIHAGPLFSLLIDGKSDASTMIDYEAIYAYENGAFTYNKDDKETDWQITREATMTQGSNYVVDYFMERQAIGYNVGLDERIEKTDTFEQKVGISGNIRAGVLFKLTDNLSFLAGGDVLFGKIKNQADDNYRLTDKAGEYSTMMSGTNDLQIFSYGLSIGVSYQLDIE